MYHYSTNFTKKRTSKRVKKYNPSLDMKEVFKEAFKRSGLDDMYIDEFRKIYFLWFYKYYLAISEGNKTNSDLIVEIPYVGTIVMHWKPVLSTINSLSYTKKEKTNFRTVNAKYRNLLYKSFILVEKFCKHFNNKRKDGETIDSGRIIRQIKRKSYFWSKNFKQRGFNIGPYEDTQSNNDCQGVFF